ncbi:MAG: hypothetical protein RLZZ164_141 [Actinomycetota bacterium]
MAILLAIDTSAGTSVALFKNELLVCEKNFESNMKHAESIGAAIHAVLAEAGVRGSEVQRVVVGRGPAPFTGLRVGIGAAVMFTEAAKARLSGVVSLDAIALSAFAAGLVASETVPLLVTTDARRGEVYWALYSGLGKTGAPERIEGPQVLKPAALDELLAARGIHPVTTSQAVSAAAIGELAIALDRAGQLEADVTALYLRAPDAVEPKSPTQFAKKVSS